jgi:transposase-like protein
MVRNGYERQFTYVYGAISPIQGQLDWCLAPQMNTAHMASFLQQVSQAHAEDFILLVLDGASSHKAKELTVPENIRLLPLPPYSPELNPQEHVWDELREKEFPNRVMDNMDQVIRQLQDGLKRLANDSHHMRSLSGWPWIISLNLTAN